MTSRSSSSQAARGSPSRGCPTLPGFSSHSPLERSSRSPSRRGSPRRELALVADERERDVGVPDQADALALHVQAQLGEQVGEHVLPDGVARAGVEEPDRLLLALGRSVDRKPRFSGEITSRVHCAAMRAPLENSSSEISPGDGEVVVAGEAHRDMLAREFDAGVRLGAVADEVAQAPQLGCLAVGDGLERGLEGVPVGVDVGDDGDLHRCRVRTPRVLSGSTGRSRCNRATSRRVGGSRWHRPTRMLGSSTPPYSGRFLMPSRVRHLE